MTMRDDALRDLTRRHFFQQAGFGIGSIALSALLARDLRAQEAVAQSDGARRPTSRRGEEHHLPVHDGRALAAGPLRLQGDAAQDNDQPVPEEVIKGERFAFIKGIPKLLGLALRVQPLRAVGRHGLLAACRTCRRSWTTSRFVKSVHTNHFNHAPAQVFMNTGHTIVGRPSMGSWLTYGLGSESSDLPGFVVLHLGKIDPAPAAPAGRAASSDHLPGRRVPLEGRPGALRLEPRRRRPRGRGNTIETLRALNQKHLDQTGDPEIATRIAAYEMAYRMQSSVPELVDVSREPKWIHEMYGTEPGKNSFANNCLPGAAPGRARRPLRPALPPRLGPPRHGSYGRHPALAAGTLPPDRPGGGGPREGPEGARPARRHARDLGRRVRPDADERVARERAVHGPRPPPARVHDVDGGRRHQAGVTIGATDELGYNVAEDRSTSTTSTRRRSTSWASTTSS
jgi:hypothetical protein